MGDYNSLKESDFVENIDIRIRGHKNIYEVEWCEGVRINIDSLPNGKHCYETRHADNNDWCTPVEILPEGCKVSVNYCGAILTDEPLDIKEETAIMMLGKK